MISLNLITIGSRWFSGTRDRIFVVTNLYEKDEDMWVSYANGDRTYSCLIEAFTQRFIEITNEN
jgi:hypothetical protein